MWLKLNQMTPTLLKPRLAFGIKTVCLKIVGVAFLLAISFVAVRADTVVITNGSVHGKSG
jgi:hypothetical protein